MGYINENNYREYYYKSLECKRLYESNSDIEKYRSMVGSGKFSEMVTPRAEPDTIWSTTLINVENNPALKEEVTKHSGDLNLGTTKWAITKDGYCYNMSLIRTYTSILIEDIRTRFKGMEGALNQLSIWYTFRIPTMATDGKRIMINPAYFLWLDSEIPFVAPMFVIIHEVYHNLMMHFHRHNACRTKRPNNNLANIAMDLEINPLIEALDTRIYSDVEFETTHSKAEVYRDDYGNIITKEAYLEKLNANNQERIAKGLEPIVFNPKDRGEYSFSGVTNQDYHKGLNQYDGRHINAYIEPRFFGMAWEDIYDIIKDDPEYQQASQKHNNDMQNDSSDNQDSQQGGGNQSPQQNGGQGQNPQQGGQSGGEQSQDGQNGQDSQQGSQSGQGGQEGQNSQQGGQASQGGNQSQGGENGQNPQQGGGGNQSQGGEQDSKGGSNRSQGGQQNGRPDGRGDSKIPSNVDGDFTDPNNIQDASNHVMGDNASDDIVRQDGGDPTQGKQSSKEIWSKLLEDYYKDLKGISNSEQKIKSNNPNNKNLAGNQKNLLDFIKSVLKPFVDYRKHLEDFLYGSIGAPSDKIPHRKYINYDKYIRQDTFDGETGDTLYLFIDTSGSMSDALPRVVKEILSIAKNLEGVLNNVAVFNVDAEIHSCDIYTIEDLVQYSKIPVPAFTVKGNGGTDMEKVFQFLRYAPWLKKQPLSSNASYNINKLNGREFKVQKSIKNLLDYEPCASILISDQDAVSTTSGMTKKDYPFMQLESERFFWMLVDMKGHYSFKPPYGKALVVNVDDIMRI